MCDKWISNSSYRVCITKSSFNSNRLYNCTLFRIKGNIVILSYKTAIVDYNDTNSDRFWY